jgi:hypothetical protein
MLKLRRTLLPGGAGPFISKLLLRTVAMTLSHRLGLAILPGVGFIDFHNSGPVFAKGESTDFDKSAWADECND